MRRERPANIYEYSEMLFNKFIRCKPEHVLLPFNYCRDPVRSACVLTAEREWSGEMP